MQESEFDQAQHIYGQMQMQESMGQQDDDGSGGMQQMSYENQLQMESATMKLNELQTNL